MGTIFKLSVAGPSTSMAEAENTKSARCKKSLKEDSIKKTLKLAICFTTIPALKDHMNQQWEQEVRNRMYFGHNRIAFTVD